MIEEGDTEEVDGLVVLEPEQRPVTVAQRSAAPAVQTAAVAAGGLVAGAVLARVLSSRRRRSLIGRALRKIGVRGRRHDPKLLDIVASRSLLVDVHLLDASNRGR